MSSLLFDPIIDQLCDQKYAVSTSFFNPTLVSELYDEGEALWKLGDYRKARIGLEENLKPEIRTDRIHWLEQDSLSEKQHVYWQQMMDFAAYVNRSLYLGIESYEAHFAVYPSGSFYKKHLDQFASTSYRMISCLLYLNKSWKEKHGGQLRMYLDGNKEIDIYPEFGTFVCFLSGDIEHEVLPSNRERFSLTGWLRREKIFAL